MSELITRRTFLKATGAAALVAAAGSMLVGCGEGYGATPGNPTLPTLDTSHYKGLSSYSVGMGAFSGTFESNSVYESDGCRHYYLYTALGFQSVDTSFSLSKNQITFTFKKGNISKNARSLDNFVIDSATQKYKYFETVPINTGNSVIPLYVDLGSIYDVNISHVGPFTVTYRDGSNTVTFSYSSPLDTTPSIG
ncbi:MAG: twin-arginine translocation signal domain-containing protein [Faecalibacterium prausnitzii]|nr:twin-arginine translocation signal domain-containing protein [Faecalibacterium prausnitzii]